MLTAAILGSSLAYIDGSVVNVALPVLQSDLKATVSDLQWIVEAYALMLASLLLVGGSLGDIYGRRKLFLIGISIFGAASAACGLAADAQQLIVARTVQGIGGALLIPGSLAILSATFSEDERGAAIGTWSGASAMTTALGPILGGWLIQQASWRWAFLINPPIALAVIVILFTKVPESNAGIAGRRLDVPGALLATAGLGALIFGLIESNTAGLGAPSVVTTIVLGAALLSAFVYVELHVEQPMLPFDLFKSPPFSGTNAMTFFLYGALAGSGFFLAYNLIQVQGYSPAVAGAAMLPSVLMMFVLSRWSGGLVKRFGPRRPLIIGPLIVALGFYLYSIAGLGGSYWLTFFPALVVQGLGMGITVAPLTTTVMGSVGKERAGIASGINNAITRTASLIAIALAGVSMLAVFSASLASRLDRLSMPEAERASVYQQRARLVDIALPVEQSAETKAGLDAAIRLSFVDGFQLVTRAAAIMAVVSALVAAAMIKPVDMQEEESTALSARKSGESSPPA